MCFSFLPHIFSPKSYHWVVRGVVHGQPVGQSIMQSTKWGPVISNLSTLARTDLKVSSRLESTRKKNQIKIHFHSEVRRYIILNICHHMLTSSTQVQNRSFHLVERTRTSAKRQKIKSAWQKCKSIVFLCQICKFMTFFMPSSSWLLKHLIEDELLLLRHHPRTSRF